MTVTRGLIQSDLRIPEDFRLQTERLELTPGNSQLANTEWQDRTRLSELLGARIPDEWPPELVIDRSDADGAGWWDWYVVQCEGDDRVLIGMAGVKGWPLVSGSVQLGCAFLPEFQEQGYGTEAVDGLTSWALKQPRVDRVLAEVTIGNDGAVGVLRKLGFTLSNTDERERLL